jgi:hypothetical protein
MLTNKMIAGRSYSLAECEKVIDRDSQNATAAIVGEHAEPFTEGDLDAFAFAFGDGFRCLYRVEMRPLYGAGGSMQCGSCSEPFVIAP